MSQLRRGGHFERFTAVIIPSSGEPYASPAWQDLRPSQLLARSAKADCAWDKDHCWWRITVHPKTICGGGSTGEQLAQVPTVDQISQLGRPTSSLKVILTLTDATRSQRVIVVDVGAGFTFYWYGANVEINAGVFADPAASFLYPVQLVTPQTAALPLASIVETTLLEVNAEPMRASSGQTQLPLTCTEVFNTARPSGRAYILSRRPPGARRMTLDQSYAATQGYWAICADPSELVTPPDDSLGAGYVYPRLGVAVADRGMLNHPVPGPAGWFVVNTAPNDVVDNATITWEIEP